MPSDKNSGLLVKEPHMTNLMGKPEAVVSESDMENSAAHKDLSVINFDEINKVIGIQYQVQESLNEQENVINNFIKLMKK